MHHVVCLKRQTITHVEGGGMYNIWPILSGEGGLECLPTLQLRQKWTWTHRNISKVDGVMIIDCAPRASWILGKVQSVLPDQKGTY